MVHLVHTSTACRKGQPKGIGGLASRATYGVPRPLPPPCTLTPSQSKLVTLGDVLVPPTGQAPATPYKTRESVPTGGAPCAVLAQPAQPSLADQAHGPSAQRGKGQGQGAGASLTRQGPKADWGSLIRAQDACLHRLPHACTWTHGFKHHDPHTPPLGWGRPPTAQSAARPPLPH